MKLSVIIPCYNEKDTIKEIVKEVLSSKIKNLEIIIVDDCSKDGTKEILKNEIDGNLKKVQVFYHSKNKGKGSAINTAIKHIKGDIVLIQDADLEYHPRDYPNLLKPVLEDKAEVVYGTRFRGDRTQRVTYFWTFVANKLLTIISNMTTNLYLTDMCVGYKVFKTEILRKIIIKENSYGIEPELTAKIARLKCRIYEVGISYTPRTYEEGKKIKLSDAIRIFYCILRYKYFD